jgi:hypothetical protein
VHLAEDHHLIQALAAQCADQAFRTAILPWRPRRDRSVADTHRPHPRCEDMPAGAVVVAHRVARRRGPGKRLGDLPSQPLGCRMPCHLEPTAGAGRDPGLGTQTSAQRSASAQRTRWRRLPQRDFAETSSRIATAASKVAPCIWRTSTGLPQSHALEAHHGSGMRPTAGFPCSSAGSDHDLDDAMILPYDANPGRMEFSERTVRKATPVSARHRTVSKSLRRNRGSYY